MNVFLSSLLNVFYVFFSTPFVSNIYMIALAGLGLIYIIKSFIFIGRSSF